MTVNLKFYEGATWVQLADAQKLDGLIFSSWGNIWQDADLTYYPLFRSGGRFTKNWSQATRTSSSTSSVEEGRSTLDEGKRKDIYSRIQRLVFDDCPAVFMHAIEDVYGVNNRIEWKPRSDGDGASQRDDGEGLTEARALSPRVGGSSGGAGDPRAGQLRDGQPARPPPRLPRPRRHAPMTTRCPPGPSRPVGFVVILGVLFLVFIILQLTGDPARLMLCRPRPPWRNIERVPAPDGASTRPLPEQFLPLPRWRGSGASFGRCSGGTHRPAGARHRGGALSRHRGASAGDPGLVLSRSPSSLDLPRP